MSKFLLQCSFILGIRIRSEGLAQVMTKRNASELHHRKYTEIPTRDTVVAGLSSGLARWSWSSVNMLCTRVESVAWRCMQ